MLLGLISDTHGHVAFTLEAVRMLREFDVALLTNPEILALNQDVLGVQGRRVPGTRVLILSMHTDEAYVIQAVQAGALGYVLKESAGTEIVEAIAALRAGRSFFSPAVKSILLDDYVRTLTQRGLTDRYDTLSEREREVLQLVAEGRSTREIADLLAISVATVETHRAHILQKLDLKNTAAVVLFAARRGIVS